MKLLDEHRCFSGRQLRFQHDSTSCHCPMTFSLYLPLQAQFKKVPLLTWLSGLTCTDENFSTKAGAQQYAAQHGIALLIPDTSPRGMHIADEEDYDLGQGAGFYVDATQSPWKSNYQMASYIIEELPALLHENKFPVDLCKQSLSGHSMGGHGALTLGIRHAQRYRSISALAPVVAPSECDWGRKALQAYLGKDESNWQAYDACQLIMKQGCELPILIDQGTADPFLEAQLKTERFKTVCAEVGADCQIRMQAGYDHSYYFIASFIADHIAFHAKALA